MLCRPEKGEMDVLEKMKFVCLSFVISFLHFSAFSILIESYYLIFNFIILLFSFSSPLFILITSLLSNVAAVNFFPSLFHQCIFQLHIFGSIISFFFYHFTCLPSILHFCQFDHPILHFVSTFSFCPFLPCFQPLTFICPFP